MKKDIDSHPDISKFRETGSIRNCSTKAEIKQFMTPAPYYVHSEFLQSHPFACDTVQAIYHTREIILHKESGQWFVLDIYVHTHYKTIDYLMLPPSNNLLTFLCIS